jgi:glycosyltransferase involved in cell wall biosynthesis
MRLCFICYEYPSGPSGGVGTFTQVLARALVQRGHEVRVAGVYPTSYPAPDYEEDEGVRVWRLRDSGARFGWVMARYRLFRLVADWVARGMIELVEAPDCYGWFAGWPPLGAPLVARAHGSLTYYAHELQRPLARTGHCLERMSYRRADAWVAVSRHAGELTQRLFRLRQGPAAVLYNPVEVPVREGERSCVRGRVVFSGTLTPKKGIVSLVDAWPAIAGAIPGAALHVFGKDQRAPDGTTMVDWLRRRLPEGARASIVFHGHVDRAVLLEALRHAEVAAFPSFTETFGLGAVEAMSVGCPIVYTKLSCGPEIVSDGVTGLLAHPGNPLELAGAILRLLRDRRFAARLGAAAENDVRTRFALPTLVLANERFYEDQIRRFRGQGDLAA